MKRLPRDPMRFDIFQHFAARSDSSRAPLAAPERLDSFISHVRASIKESLDNEAFLHGLKTQELFLALVASLGSVKLIKDEDAGSAFADGDYNVPDFRIVTSDDVNVLVEVKNYYQTKSRAFVPFEVDGDYLRGLERYAALTNAKVGLALYWAAWNTWTLVPTHVFKHSERDPRKRSLAFGDAMMANRMSDLGDLSLGTRVPLTFQFEARVEDQVPTDKGFVEKLVIERVALLSESRVLTGEAEQNIAFYMMLFGSWPVSDPQRKEIDASRVQIDLVCAPEESASLAQGFDIVGSLSGMFSRFYHGSVLEGSAVRELHADFEPGRLGRLVPKGYRSVELPLWIFKMTTDTEWDPPAT